MAVAIKEFLWAGNGHTVETLKPGDERDFGAHEVGLTVAGLITSEPATADAADEPAPANDDLVLRIGSVQPRRGARKA